MTGDVDADPLAPVADLIAQAHDMLAASAAQDDPGVEALLANLEDCFLAVHRLILKRRAGARR